MMACPVLSDPFWKLIQVDRNTVEKEIEEASNKCVAHILIYTALYFKNLTTIFFKLIICLLCT